VRAVASVIAAVALAVPASAAAVIVPQRGMAGARIGMTVGQVRDKVGKPTHIAFVRHPIIGRIRVWSYGRTRVTFDGDGRSARVIAMDTTSRRERLANGIGVGSVRAAVDTRVPGARCKVEFGFDHCWVGEFRAGRIVTDFAIKGGRVMRVSVARVID
jgi:hypothetical protein